MIAGNWKMYKTAPEAAAFVGEVARSSDELAGVDCVVCAPFTALPAAVEAGKGSAIGVGAQNMHWENSGAFTGEVSGAMLADLGVRYVIVGHSERRAYFADTDETVNKKTRAAYTYGLTPIVCVGEQAAEREEGRTKEVCRAQVLAALEGLTAEQVASAVIAYEPVWAIGTGKPSTAEDANETIAWIRSAIAGRFGDDAARNVRILYGGSVKPDNIRSFLDTSDIDGALVGGASLDPDSYLAMVKHAKG